MAVEWTASSRGLEDNNSSLLALIGNAVSWIFYPLGWVGDRAWNSTVATITGRSPRKKLSIPSVFFTIASGELSEAGNEIWTLIAADFTALSGRTVS